MHKDLKHSEQLWGMALEIAGFGVWDLDPINQTVHYSPEWKSMLGYPSEDVADSTATWRARVHPDDLLPMAAALSNHLEGVSPAYEFEFRLRAADGAYRWVLSRGRVVARDAQRRALRAVGTLTDLTDRRQAEALRAERDRAEAASRAKTEFLSRMSHELRTPLNAVLGFAQLLASRMTDPQQAEERRQVAHIECAGWQLLSMVDNVLDLSHVESGQLKLHIEAVSLAPLLKAAAAAVQQSARRQGVRLELAEAPAHAAVLADAERLRQVLFNLLSNAIKFNRIAGSVTVAVNAVAEPSAWSVSVIDTGIGIPAAQMQHLFEPFNRLGRVARATEGFGIGLALTRWLVHSMGGRLDVQSTEGLGTTFTVTLPGAPIAAERGVKTRLQNAAT